MPTPHLPPHAHPHSLAQMSAFQQEQHKPDMFTEGWASRHVSSIWNICLEQAAGKAQASGTCRCSTNSAPGDATTESALLLASAVWHPIPICPHSTHHTDLSVPFVSGKTGETSKSCRELETLSAGTRAKHFQSQDPWFPDSTLTPGVPRPTHVASQSQPQLPDKSDTAELLQTPSSRHTSSRDPWAKLPADLLHLLD